GRVSTWMISRAWNRSAHRRWPEVSQPPNVFASIVRGRPMPPLYCESSRSQEAASSSAASSQRATERRAVLHPSSSESAGATEHHRHLPPHLLLRDQAACPAILPHCRCLRV